VFRKKGAAWIVRFGGGEERLVLATKGAAYIYLLLSNPGKHLSAVDMAYEVAKEPKRYQLGNAGPRADRDAFAAYKARHDELREEYDEAVGNQDIGRQESARRELEQLAAELKRSKWAKEERDDRERVRKSVSAAITRAVRGIQKYDAKLAKHLCAPTLRCGRSPIYDPQFRISWDL
jgi:predicted Zn-dependent protease